MHISIDWIDCASAARKADYVVYLGGIDGTVEAEGHDRTSIDLPQIQVRL